MRERLLCPGVAVNYPGRETRLVGGPSMDILSPDSPSRNCEKCGSPKKYYLKGRQWRCIDCLRIKAREQRALGKYLPTQYTPNERRDKNYQQNYGITLDQYNWLLACQNGVCAICGRPETKIMRGKVAPLSIDHCHKTTRIRALLCHKCNLAFGYMREDPEQIKKLLKYAKKWQGT